MPLPLIIAAWAIGSAAAGGSAAGGTGLLKMRGAKQVVNAKNAELESASEGLKESRRNCEAAFAALGETKLQAISGALLPFHEAFSKLKHVDLAVEVSAEGAPGLDPVRVREAGRLTVDLASALGISAVGVGVGAMASTGTTMAVTSLAAAGTGSAISGLSGVAASNAMLAWLGGGTLAAGGGGIAAGTMVLSGIATAPALLVGGVFLHHKGREAKAKAEEFSADVDKALADVRTSRTVLDGAGQQATAVRQVLDRLVPMLASGAGWLNGQALKRDDWRDFDTATKDEVRKIAALAMATSELVHTPLMNEDGTISAALRRAVRRGSTIAG